MKKISEKQKKRRDAAWTLTAALLDARLASNSSEDYFTLVDPLCALIDRLVILGGTKEGMLTSLKKLGTSK